MDLKNRFVLIARVAILATCVPVLMASAGLPGVAAAAAEQSAVGNGTMAFGHENEGRGYFLFNIRQGDEITGTLLFAAEDHHEMMYPDIIVRMAKIETAKFGRHSVKFSGPGALHDDPVAVTVTAHDNASSRKADRFTIKCVNGKGKVVFEAKGDVFLGDIQVGTAAD